MSYREGIKRLLKIELLPLISYFVLGPIEIYYANTKDFAFELKDFAPYILILGALLCSLFAIVIAVFSEKIFYISSSLIISFGVSSYFQNMFMNIKLSEINGAPMDWAQLGAFRWFNLGIWIAIIILFLTISLKLEKYWKEISETIALGISLVQIIALVSLLILNFGKSTKTDNLQMSGENQFKVAAENNIIVFVIDTFGNQQMKNALQEYPDILNNYNDFTYYSNNDCHYYCTFPSMTHMLTGNAFDFYIKSQDWMQTSWESEHCDKFYDMLQKNGYTCELYSSDIGYIYGDAANLYGKFENIVPMEKKVDHWALTKKMLKMSIYRYVPYFLKPRFELFTKDFNALITYKDGKAPITDNSDFYHELQKNKIEISKEYNKAFIIQHLHGTHLPYETSESGDRKENATINETVSGVMNILRIYLNELKEIGVYDSSTIIITADHGSWVANGCIDPQPVYFIKRQQEVHTEIQTCSAPISADDFQATILAVANLDYSKFGTSVFDWSDDEERERSVYMRGTDTEYPSVEGSIFNVYYQFDYLTNGDELIHKIEKGNYDAVLPATPW